MASDSKQIKWQNVINEWFRNNFNGTKAYLKFHPHVSDNTAKVNFSKLLTKTNVQEYIGKKHHEAQKRAGIDHADMMNELVNYVYADITQLIALTPAEVKELPDHVKRLITSYKHVKRTVGKGKEKQIIEEIQVKFVSKERALDMLAKHIGFYGEHNYQKNVHLTKEERAERIAELKQKLNLRKVS